MLYTRNAYVGFAVHNINTPILSFYNLPDKIQRKFTVHAGYEHKLDSCRKGNSTISLNGLWIKQSEFEQINLGLQFHYGNMVGGLWERKLKSPYNDYSAVVLSTGYHAKKWGSNLSFDMSFLEKRNSNPLSVELSFFYTWGSKNNNNNKSIINLPSILTQ